MDSIDNFIKDQTDKQMSQLNANLKEVKTDMNKEITELNANLTEVKTDMNQLQSEMNISQEKAKTDVKSDLTKPFMSSVLNLIPNLQENNQINIQCLQY